MFSSLGRDHLQREVAASGHPHADARAPRRGRPSGGSPCQTLIVETHVFFKRYKHRRKSHKSTMFSSNATNIDEQVINQHMFSSNATNIDEQVTNIDENGQFDDP